MKDCIFCQIIAKKIPKRILFENREVMAFEDIKPKAPVHLLIISKKHLPSLAAAGPKDKALIAEMIWAAKKIAEKENLKKRGYRLLVNTGREAGQEIEHLHFHLLGGGKLPAF